MNTLICDAIRARRLIRFAYDGYERVAEPHLYGISSASREVLSAYLVGGWSASEGAPGWRKYLVREMLVVSWGRGSRRNAPMTPTARFAGTRRYPRARYADRSSALETPRACP
jgi:hypothetical protein